LFLTVGCGAGSWLPPNPFGATPTLVAAAPTATVVLTAVPTAQPEATPQTFAPFWVRNHRETEMWSGQVGQTGVVSFGLTTAQFCVFQVILPQDGPRLFVINPLGQGQFWIDADAVGPVSDPPQRATGPRPEDQNCADVLYDAP